MAHGAGAPGGLADAIVDLVSTGSTLRANNLVAVEEVMAISARLIVNQAALKLKGPLIQPLMQAIAQAVQTEASHAAATCFHAGRGFRRAAHALLAFENTQDESIEQAVAAILADVRQRGDAALLEYTRRFDRVQADAMTDLQIARGGDRGRFRAAYRCAPRRAGARRQPYPALPRAPGGAILSYTDADGTRLGQQVTPLDRVGIYVPQGGVTSSVLMNATAKSQAAGNRDGTSADAGGERNDLVLAAAAVCGVDRVIAVGGAQAVAALAYGTATIPKVDKIVGPGNAYVAAAKRRVFGLVGIDMVAGPSEILVVCDGRTNPTGRDGPVLPGRA